MPTAIVDPQAAALCTLLDGGINAEIESGDPMRPTVKKAFPFLLDKGRRTAGVLPALLIYRLSERSVRRTVAHRERVVTWRFEYHLAATGIDKAGEMTPLLSMVWGQCVDLVCAGHHADVSSNALILRAAGFVDVEDLGPVNYGQPTEATDLAPHFIGTMVLRHRNEIDTSALADLVSLDASYWLVGGTGDTALADGDQPLVREILTS